MKRKGSRRRTATAGVLLRPKALGSIHFCPPSPNKLRPFRTSNASPTGRRDDDARASDPSTW